VEQALRRLRRCALIRGQSLEGMRPDRQTTIVGAGPYGLSIAAHLRARGARFEVLGAPLESWRSFMPQGMVLKSEPFASNLWDPQRRYTLRRYCQARRLPWQSVGSPIGRELFLEYAEWFLRQTCLEPRTQRVIRVRRAPGGFRLQLADGSELTSARVVLATGHMAFRVVPPQLAALAEPLVMHSTLIGDLRRYTGREVCVIGAGQSALETAALLHENGARVRLVIRRDHIEWNAPSKPRPVFEQILKPDAGIALGWRSVAVSELPRLFRASFAPQKRHRFVAHSYGPSGSWWLRERVEGRIPVKTSSRLASAELIGGGVRLKVEDTAGSATIDTQHIVAATGFRVDISRLDYLDPALLHAIDQEAPGMPALDSHFETSVPGLFMVGLASAPVFGPIMRFMYGAKHVAPLISARAG
jgi:thioredoxin reductase